MTVREPGIPAAALRKMFQRAHENKLRQLCEARNKRLKRMPRKVRT